MLLLLIVYVCSVLLSDITFIISFTISYFNMLCNKQGSPRLHAGPGGPSSPTPMPYQQYTQRYSSPTRPHAPYSHHQVYLNNVFM